MPKVSIIVPNYNHARFLRRRIETVLGQTFQDFEVILLDDCSTDDSRAILATYADDPKVRIECNQANSGNPFKQWNKGVALARGEYVWIAESDDYADDRFLETLVGRLDREPTAAFAYCRSWRVSVDGQPDGLVEHFGAEQQQRWQADYCADGYVECCQFLVNRNTVPNASAVVFRKAAYRDVGGADETLRLCGDWKLWATMAMGGKIIYVAEPLNYYRFHGSTVRNVTSQTGADYREIFRLRLWVLGQVTGARPLNIESPARGALANGYMLLAFESYPQFADISRIALQRVRELGGATIDWRYGTWKVQLLERIIGWKATKRVHAIYGSILSKSRKRADKVPALVLPPASDVTRS